jgi:hypothetical protein
MQLRSIIGNDFQKQVVNHDLHLKLGRIEGFDFFTQIELIEGFALFLHKKCIEVIQKPC